MLWIEDGWNMTMVKKYFLILYKFVQYCTILIKERKIQFKFMFNNLSNVLTLLVNDFCITQHRTKCKKK